MLFPWTLLQLAGAVALLLWGVHMVQTGVQRAFGARLRSFLGTALRDRGRAFLAGIGVTAILQSSTATGLMVTGFAAGGLVDLVPALAVMLGANVGTTLIVQLLSFNVAEIAPVLILIGVLMFRRASAGPRDFGRVFIGLGLVLMAVRQFGGWRAPYEDAPSLRMVLGSIATEPVLDVILAAGLTWAAHSSVAIVLVVMSFASKGTVPLDAAFALVLGANLGTAINPLLEGNTKDQVAKRLPIGNLCNRVVGVVIALLLLGPVGRLLATLETDPGRAVADFHTGFNLLMAAISFPFLGPFATLLRRWLPTRVDAADPATPLYLDSAAHETPVVALGGAAREALRLADVLEAMLQGFGEALERGDRRRVEETKRLDDVLDRLDSAIKSYMTALETEAMSEADHDRARSILTFALNLEAAGDVVDKGLLASVTKQLRRGVAFPAEVRAELSEATNRLIGNVRAAAALFMNRDERAARLLAAEKGVFRDLEAKATELHFEQVRSAARDTAEMSALHLEILRDMKRVNAYLVEGAAYPVLAGNGELLSSRVRESGDGLGAPVD